MNPEAKARQLIDQKLEQAGWVVQDRKQLNLSAGIGVAVREYPTDTGPADYVLFVNRIARGVIEAKKDSAGENLTATENQTERYATASLKWRQDNTPLRFLFEATGQIIRFTDNADPLPRSREIFHFFKPETLAAWSSQSETLRRRLAEHLPPLPERNLRQNLRQCQISAVSGLEKSLAQNKPRSLVHMATGAGKTFTAITAVYRLLKFGGARRILFLVDTRNLGKQAHQEFMVYTPPDDGRKFTELYNVQRLASPSIDPHAQVYISTIQRMYSILSGEPIDESAEDVSLNEIQQSFAQEKLVRYSPAVPVETFDFIIIDECHRSIYNLWKQVLDYFDAFLIGLTATPDKRTFGFFNENIVAEYTYEQSVADGVNVGYDVYEIETEITQKGAELKAKEWIDHRDRQTRKKRWSEIEEDTTYTNKELDKSVVNVSQIRQVIQAMKSAVEKHIFPARKETPKTLIFAKTDSHADDIIQIVREVYGQGNTFCKKVTYRAEEDADSILSSFRNDYNPRIAVTVDMIATGTDIKAIEILIFLRMVKSRSYFEQMLGRGTRVISTDDLKRVTGNAHSKDRFIIVDVVGVTEQEQVEIARPLDRQRSVTLPDLLKQIAYGAADADTLATLASRLARLQHKVTPQDEYTLAATSGGLTLPDLIHELLNAVDREQQIAAAMQATGRPEAALTDAEIEAAATQLLQQAADRYATRPPLCTALNDLAQRTFVTHDDHSRDLLLKEGFTADTMERSRQLVTNFEAYLAAHKDEIAALSVLYQQPYQRQTLTRAQLKELAAQLQQPPHSWTTEALWRAYAQLEKDRVRGLNTQRVLTDIVALVRHALHSDPVLQPYPELVQQRYQDWLVAQQAAGRTFTAQQRWWLDRIAERIGLDLTVTPADLNQGDFRDRGGPFAAARELGPSWQHLLDELNTALMVV